MVRRPLVPLLFASISLGLAASVWISPGRAQVPDTFKNLEVLPQNISKPELMDTMKSFAMGLGVRCEHCHVGEAGRPLSEFDFASDEKAPKKTARVMMRMLKTINGDLDSALGEHDTRVQVECITCHRGQPHPRMLEDVLLEEYQSNGGESAVAAYREYREQHFGGFSFDFGERPLLSVAAAVTETDPKAALAILDLNLEFHPESIGTLVQLGDLHLAQGNQDAAVRALEKAYELRPHPMLKQKLEQAKGSE